MCDSVSDSSLVDCVFYLKGNCKNQSTCKFRHQEGVQKTVEVCDNWLEGKCVSIKCLKRHPDVRGIRCNSIQLLDRILVKQLMDEGFNKADCYLAVQHASDFDSAKKFLTHNCALCLNTFPLSRMFSIITCDHTVCRKCAVNHFEYQIKNFSVVNVVCPFPDCTDLKHKSDEEIQDYFALFLPQMKALLTTELVELLEKKVRDWSLASDPNFVWCPKCENGMFFDDLNTNYVECEGCNCRICPQCKLEWTQQHVGLTCVKYKRFVNDDKDSRQIEAIDKLLGNFGVECPRCKSKYVKSSGGCLHLTCPNCKYQFCEGCLNQYYEPKRCPNPICRPQGFHAHHSRNCFYYLRDWEPQRLQRFLNSKDIFYETETLHSGKICPLLEQKDGENGNLLDEPCGLELYSAGLCRKHYVQYLGWLVLKNKLDPLPFFSDEELENLLTRCGAKIPPKTNNYHEILLKQISYLEDIGTLSEATTISESFSSVITDKKKKNNCQNNLVEDNHVVPLRISKPHYPERYYDDDDDDDYEDVDDDDDYDDYDNSEGVGKPVVTQQFTGRNFTPIKTEVYQSTGQQRMKNTTVIPHATSGYLRAYPNFPRTCGDGDEDEDEEDDEDDDDDEEGAVGGKILPSSAKENKNEWPCNYCTFLNPLSSKVCSACYHSRMIGFEDYELTFDGIQCIKCTLINEEGATVCVVCESPLNQSSY